MITNADNKCGIIKEEKADHGLYDSLVFTFLPWLHSILQVRYARSSALRSTLNIEKQTL
jgi:hypothetical protein